MTWNLVEATSLDEVLIQALLDSKVAAVRIRGFLTEVQCEEASNVIGASPDWSYYEGTTPPVGRLGMSQYEKFGEKDRYFEEASVQRASRVELLKDITDPLDLLMRDLRDVWPAPVSVASEDGQSYFAGIFRRGAGTAIHSDWAPRDAVGWRIGDARAQLAWNLYYDTPGDGGDLVVFDRPWTEDMEQYARQRFYDYDPESVSGVGRCAVRLSPGDAVFFNARNAHMVTPSPAGERRLSVGTFIGEMPDRELLLWS